MTRADYQKYVTAFLHPISGENRPNCLRTVIARWYTGPYRKRRNGGGYDFFRTGERLRHPRDLRAAGGRLGRGMAVPLSQALNPGSVAFGDPASADLRARKLSRGDAGIEFSARLYRLRNPVLCGASGRPGGAAR